MSTARKNDELCTKLYDFLNEKNDWVTSKDLGEEFGLSRESIKAQMQYVKAEHHDVVSNRARGYRISIKSKREFDKPFDRYPDNKNSEGYSDPTAAAAIKSYEAQDPYARMGEVWRTIAANGDIEYFLILSEWGGKRFGVPLYIVEPRYAFYPIKIDCLGGAVLYGDAVCAKNKPSKYMETCIGTIDHEMVTDICHMVYRVIGFEAGKEAADKIEVDNTVYDKNAIRELLTAASLLEVEIDKTKKLSTELEAANANIEELKNDRIELGKYTIVFDGDEYDLAAIEALHAERNKFKLEADNQAKLAAVYKSELEKLREPDFITINGERHTASDILEIMAQAAVLQKFFASYCKGLERGDF